MPPWRAIAIAIRDSVTVSIALETSGTRRLISRVSRVVVSTSLGIDVGLPRQQQHVVVGQADGGELVGDAGGGEVHGAFRAWTGPPVDKAAVAAQPALDAGRRECSRS